MHDTGRGRVSCFQHLHCLLYSHPPNQTRQHNEAPFRASKYNIHWLLGSAFGIEFLELVVYVGVFRVKTHQCWGLKTNASNFQASDFPRNSFNRCQSAVHERIHCLWERKVVGYKTIQNDKPVWFVKIVNIYLMSQGTLVMFSFVCLLYHPISRS